MLQAVWSFLEQPFTSAITILALLGWNLWLQTRDRRAKKRFYKAGEMIPSSRGEVEGLLNELSRRALIDGDSIKEYSIVDKRSQMDVTVDFGDEFLPFTFAKKE